MSLSTGTVVFEDATLKAVELVAETMTLNNFSVSSTTSLQQATNTGNVTTNTVEFTNPTTAFVTTGNVGIGMTDPGHNLDIVSEMNLRAVSNTASIKYNSNVVTEYVRSKKLIKYPRVVMTANSDQGYIASASATLSGGTYEPYKAFDGTTSRWSDSGSTYTASNGAYTGSTSTTVDGIAYLGEWLQIQLPEKIKLQGHTIGRSGAADYKLTTSWNYRTPYKGYLVASNDGSTWNMVDSWEYFFGLPFKRYESSSTYYKYFRLIFNEIHNNSDATSAQLSDWELYGVPEYDPEAHGTDVVMHSIANAPNNTDWLDIYWDGNNTTSYSGSGLTVTDIKSGGTAVNGTLVNGVGFDSTWNAFTFDALSSQYISATSPASGNYIHSLSMWFKGSNLTEATGDTLLWIGDNVDNKRIEIYLESDRINYSFRGNDQAALTRLINNKWYHLTCTYDGTSNENGRKIYLNGIEMPSSHTGNDAVVNISNSTLNLGGYSGTTTDYMFTGLIANFRLFNRAITADEVWQYYAYQKEYFQVSPDVATFKNGRFGIGTEEPKAVLDVRGDMIVNGGIAFPQRPIASFSHSSAVTISSDTELDGSNFYNKTWANVGGHLDVKTGRFLCPNDGIYRIYFRCTSDNTNIRLRKNGATITEAYDNSGGGDMSVSAEAIVECVKGDYLHIQIRTCTMKIGTQHKIVTFMQLA